MRLRVLVAVLVPSFVAAVFLILPASAFAQELGIKAGVNFASLTPEEDEDPDTSRRPGLVGGVWFRTAPITRFSFQAEGLFSEKGVKFDNVPFDLDSSGSIDVRVRYIEIPLLARADFGAPGSTTRVFVVGGAAPAFKLSGRAELEFEGEEQTQDIGDDTRPLDLGLVGGVGVAFGRALIEARYTHGLRHINTDDNGEGGRIKNRVLSVSVGFRFW
jgi:outer membrane protein with beta-barrel domain